MLVGLGWSFGKAQTPQPDFELTVDAPVGATKIACKKGCTLAWVERGVPSSTETRKPEFDFRLLGRCIALDANLGRRIDAWQGRSAFIDYMGEHAQRFGLPWQTLVVNEVRQTIVDDDLPAFSRWLEGEPYLLGESSVGLQVELSTRTGARTSPPACCTNAPCAAATMRPDSSSIAVST